MRKFLFFIFLLAANISAQDFTIVIDPGHGGKDPGATRGNYKEKDMNLSIALLLGNYIESKHPKTKVIYTRKTDVFVDLSKRANIANKAKADLFISLHANATDAKSTSTSGAECYVLGVSNSAASLEVAKRENQVILYEDDHTKKYEGFDPKSPESYIIFQFMSNAHREQSLEFAGLVQEKVKTIAKNTNRGVKEAGFLVLKNISMPGVLFEMGYINNSKDLTTLTTKNGQRDIASAIFAAFEEYKKEFLKKKADVSYTAPASTTQKEIIKEATPVDIKEEPKKDIGSKKTKIDGSVSEFINKSKTNPDVAPKETKQESAKQQPSQPVEKKNAIATTNESKTINTNKIEYRVQFIVLSSKISTDSSLFKGLSDIKFYKDGDKYKYTVGASTNETEIQNILKEVKKKFPDAFIVKFRNGVRIN